jgi:3-hydroxyisobutyrate dehydrogenase-like beta-hydroxyacid dehydrogenase
MTRALEVTVLGAGRMGAAIAEVLAGNGVNVRIWNRTAERAHALAGERLTPYEDLDAAVKGVDAVVSILADGAAVRATVPGALDLLPAEAVLIEASTIDVPVMTDLARGAPDRVVSCAVSGTPAVVRGGQAGVLISGAEPAKAKAVPVLEAFAARTVDVGPRVEDAKLVKIGINAVLAGTMELLAESVVLLEAGGVSREVFGRALAGSVLGSAFSAYKLAALDRRDYTATFATRDLRKDVGLALAQGAASGVVLPLARELAGLLDESVELGWGELDFLSLVPRLQRACGLIGDVG